jgi:hypothetical protein
LKAASPREPAPALEIETQQALLLGIGPRGDVDPIDENHGAMDSPMCIPTPHKNVKTEETDHGEAWLSLVINHLMQIQVVKNHVFEWLVSKMVSILRSHFDPG